MVKKLISLQMLLLLVLILPEAVFADKKDTNKVEIKKKHEIGITYISNAGFLIEVSSKKIIMDGIFGGFEADWCQVPSEELIDNIIAGKPPFDNIDYITISHKHMDHFNADMVVNFIKSHDKTELICPVEIENILKKDSSFDLFKTRIHIIPEDNDSSKRYQFGNLEIEGLNIAHGPYWDIDEKTGEKITGDGKIQNVMFLIKVGGISILHTGDWYKINEKDEDIFKTIGKVGVALVSGYGLLEQSGKIPVFIREHLSPDIIIVTHLNITNTSNEDEQLQFLIKNYTVFRKILEKQIVGIESDKQ